MRLRIIKPVIGYENEYFVSYDGNVFRKSSEYINNLGIKCIRKEVQLKPKVDNKGRQFVKLCKNGIGKDYNVARLIATAFIPNPNNYPMINHKDENPSNNCADNLEWCTNAYNQSYGTCPQRKAKIAKNREPVVKIISDNHIIIYESSRYAEKVTNINHSAIRRACSDTTGTRFCKGFRWRFPTCAELVKFNNTNKRELEIKNN